MTTHELSELLAQCPLVASVQASPGSPLEGSPALLPLAQASLQQGVRQLRLQGVEAIRAIQGATGAPVIGLVKRQYPGSPVYITPTEREVEELLRTSAQIIALDATSRPRPGRATFARLVEAIHRAGRLAMADCDTPETAQRAQREGADLIGTTLAGYTEEPTVHAAGPALDVLRAIVRGAGVPVLAEGRFAEPWQVQAALRIGAAGVVVGAALNDPVRQTRAMLAGAARTRGIVGAVDIGGTRLRWALFDERMRLLEREETPLPPDPGERLGWIRERVAGGGAVRVGVSSGGCVDPATGEVWRAKPIIPGHAGTRFDLETLGAPVIALNDGLATAWGHACLPEFAGLRVATLALGTGIGFGLVDRGRILCGPRGEPCHLNDQPAPGGAAYEELLGGGALGADPSPEARESARRAANAALAAIRGLFHPDAIVVCGGVGLAGWLDLGDAVRSPYGADAGLYGAAALAMFPPVELARV
jgi:putative N-acetylmannosamine-6-phosphate epimerase